MIIKNLCSKYSLGMQMEDGDACRLELGVRSSMINTKS